MRASVLKVKLEYALNAHVPAFLWGPPGVGKSAIVAQVAKALGAELRDVRAVQFDPVDLRGIPSIGADGRAHWSVPDFMPNGGGRGVLFLDELNAASPSVQAACYQLVLDRRLGAYVLPDGWDIIAAGNRESDRAVVNRMSSALSSRFSHFELEVSVSDWVDWALASGLPIEFPAFIRFRPELLHVFDPKSAEKIFPCPRTWEMASRYFRVAGADYDLMASVVGQGPAAEFMAFCQTWRELPDIKEILRAPKSAMVPGGDNPAAIYAVAGALARVADQVNFGAIVEYIKRLPSPEFGVLCVRDAARVHPDVQKSRAFVDWAAANQGVLL